MVLAVWGDDVTDSRGGGGGGEERRGEEGTVASFLFCFEVFNRSS
jgi:hypothetical protein